MCGLLAEEVTGGRGGRVFFGHCSVTQTQCSKSLQNIKIPPAILSCNIHVDTIETTMSSFSESFHVQSGSERVLGPGSGGGFHTFPGSCVPGEGDRDFQPFCLASGEPRTTPSARIHD